MNSRDTTLQLLATALVNSTAGLIHAHALQCASAAWDTAERLYAATGGLDRTVLFGHICPIVRDAMPTLSVRLQNERANAMAMNIGKNFTPTVPPGAIPARPHRVRWADDDTVVPSDAWRAAHINDWKGN